MVKIYSCSKKYCKFHVIYGFINKPPIRCKIHRDKKMINVVSKRCCIQGCFNIAVKDVRTKPTCYRHRAIYTFNNIEKQIKTKDNIKSKKTPVFERPRIRFLEDSCFDVIESYQYDEMNFDSFNITDYDNDNFGIINNFDIVNNDVELNINNFVEVLNFYNLKQDMNHIDLINYKNGKSIDKSFTIRKGIIGPLDLNKAYPAF
jgi:hypothetical protein